MFFFRFFIAIIVTELARKNRNTVLVCAEIPRASEILRSIARYRRASGNTRREHTTPEDFELPEELRNTMDRPGSPSERFLLYDSRND